jgi:hypothetical protein
MTSSPISINIHFALHFSAEIKFEYFALLILLVEDLTMYKNATARQRDILLSTEEGIVSCDFDMGCTDDSQLLAHSCQ